MTLGILGKKLGMTSIFKEDGTQVPVTVIQAGPCRVLQVKVKSTDELPADQRKATVNLGKKRGKQARPRRADGYYALQLAFDERPARTVSRAVNGHAAKAGGKPTYLLRELRLPAAPAQKVGDEIKVDVLNEVKRVDVVGITKGRGFTGTIKRYGFHRQAASHGNSLTTRAPGGLGRNYSISKGVPKGKRMPGHYGVERVTIQNLEVVKIDPERNLLFLRGAVPGHRQGYLLIRKSVKTSKTSK
jgi:large subunit ribosomal protein L3